MQQPLRTGAMTSTFCDKAIGRSAAFETLNLALAYSLPVASLPLRPSGRSAKSPVLACYRSLT